MNRQTKCLLKKVTSWLTGILNVHHEKQKDRINERVEASLSVCITGIQAALSKAGSLEKQWTDSALLILQLTAYLLPGLYHWTAYFHK